MIRQTKHNVDRMQKLLVKDLGSAQYLKETEQVRMVTVNGRKTGENPYGNHTSGRGLLPEIHE